MSILTARWTPMNYHPEQDRFLRSQSRFQVVWAGRGSGKTELSKRRLVMSLPVPKTWSRKMYFYAGPTRDQAERIAWDDLKALTPRQWVKGISETDLCIRTIFGSELWVVGLDKPQRIEGNQWDGGVVDEASDIKPGTRTKSILPALTHKNGWLIWAGVPKRQGVGAAEFKKMCDEAIAGKLLDTSYHTWTSGEILPPGVLDTFRASMDPKDFNEQFNANWETAGGSMFHAFLEKENVRPCLYDPNKLLIVGSDFNVSPMAWVLAHEVNGNLCVFDEVFERDTNTPATLARLAYKFQGHRGGFAFYGDATGQGRRTSATESDYDHIRGHEFFRKAGRTVDYPRSNPGVENRVSATNAMLCNAAGTRRLFVDPKCANLINDLKNRAYKPNSREPADTADLGHITDALGYVVYARYPIQPIIIPTGVARMTFGANQ